MAAKPPLLFLAHRIPYPPNKGDKIRSYHLLEYLSQYFSIYLGTFVDDPDDWKYCAAVRSYCVDTCFIERKPLLHKLLALSGLLSGSALSVSYYRSAQMQNWVNRTIAHTGIDQALLFCSPMSQFVIPNKGTSKGLVSYAIDFVDVDSEKWRQYASDKTGLGAAIYARESSALLAWEKKSAKHASKGFFVSQAEAALFRSQADCAEEDIGFFSNGVDADYFSPDPLTPNPYPENASPLVFTGAMDYPPNEDAVCWFVDEVLSLLPSNLSVEFWIVGGKPTRRVLALAQQSNVVVTGRVDDVRPYIQHAKAAVAPMRIARGVQNKVLEAMAMAKPVVVSDCAQEGLEQFQHALVNGGDTASGFASAVVNALSLNRSADVGATARRAVLKHFVWAQSLKPLLVALSPSVNSAEPNSESAVSAGVA